MGWALARLKDERNWRIYDEGKIYQSARVKGCCRIQHVSRGCRVKLIILQAREGNRGYRRLARRGVKGRANPC